MASTCCKGVVKGRTIVLKGRPRLREGTEVVVTPVEHPIGSPQAVLEALRASPPVRHEDVVELLRLIDEGKRPVRYDNPLTRGRKVEGR
jgi:hypothetical protein